MSQASGAHYKGIVYSDFCTPKELKKLFLQFEMALFQKLAKYSEVNP